MRGRWVVALLGAWFASGCYAYVPAGVGDVAPEQRVRVRLSPGEMDRLREYVNPDTRTLGGTVMEQTPDSLLLLVPGHTEVKGARVETLYQRIQVGKAGVLETEVRHLDKKKTYFLTGVAAVAATVVAVSQLKGNGGSETVPPGGGPNDALVPAYVLRLPFRLLGLLGR